MPPNNLPDDEIWQIVTYLRTLQQPARRVAGDRQRGETLFFGAAPLLDLPHRQRTRRAARAGAVDGRLRAIARVPRRLDPPSGTAADPNRIVGDSISLKYDTVTAVTSDGRTIVGVPMNEDTFTVQVMDTSERVYSLDKKSSEEFPARRPIAHAGVRHRPAQRRRSQRPRRVPAVAAHRASVPKKAAAVKTVHAQCLARASSVAASPALGAGDLGSARQRRARTAAVADVFGQLRRQPLLAARSDQQEQRAAARAAVGVSDRVRGSHETTPLVDRRRAVHHGAAESRVRDRHAHRPRRCGTTSGRCRKRCRICCGPQNRGMAALGDRLFMGTLDAHVVALDAKTGRVRWDVAAADADKGYSFTGAPLVVKDKVIIGVAGGEYGIRGFIDAYDAQTGERAWRFYTIPGEGEKRRRDVEGRLVEARRRADVGDRLVRSRPQPALLGHRQSGAADVRRQSAGRQPVFGFARRARSRHGQAEVAFPVHAARRARLGFDAHADPVRRDDRRPAAQARRGRQPQRLLLRPRSRHRRVSCSASRTRR